MVELIFFRETRRVLGFLISLGTMFHIFEPKYGDALTRNL